MAGGGIGLDPCHASLLAARRRAPDVPLVRGRADALPFRDGAFDTVVSGLVFCSVADVPTYRAQGDLRRFEARPAVEL
jgi:ubiquinone/menaquinone biosynthesis C-methylase UbiE